MSITPKYPFSSLRQNPKIKTLESDCRFTFKVHVLLDLGLTSICEP